MHQSIAAVASQYAVNTDLLFKTLEGLSQEQEFSRPEDKANAANWIVGHLLNTRFEICKMMGADASCQWTDLYGRGSKIQDSSAYPSIAEMKPVWETISADFMEKIAQLSEGDLSANNDLAVPNPEKNLRGLLGFFAIHEGIHIGQITYLRRILDQSPAFG